MSLENEKPNCTSLRSIAVTFFFFSSSSRENLLIGMPYSFGTRLQLEQSLPWKIYSTDVFFFISNKCQKDFFFFFLERIYKKKKSQFANTFNSNTQKYRSYLTQGSQFFLILLTLQRFNL